MQNQGNYQLSFKDYEQALKSFKEAASCIFEIIKITTDDQNFNASLKS